MAASPWFIRHHLSRPAPKLRLICCPHAGGSPAVFSPWASRLPPSLDMLTLQLPGHGSRLKERPFTRLTEVIEAVGPALLPHLDATPFAVLGHSMGTLIAFELTRWLRRHHHPLPVHLVVAARRAPHVRDFHGDVHRRPFEGIVEHIQKLGGTPQAILTHHEMLKIFIPIVRADYEIVETYRYTEEPPLPCSITTLAGIEDPATVDEHLELWEKHTTAGFSRSFFPGGHFFLHNQPEVLPTVLKALALKGQSLA